MRRVPTCPTCGNAARITDTQYGPRAACCGLWSWGFKPLVDAETHRARRAAHDAFDRLWKSGRLSRGQCYQKLQAIMGMSADECHMARMSRDDALRVVEIVQSGQLLSPLTNDM
jgi:hypothetical protein